MVKLKENKNITRQNAASLLGLFCLLKGISPKYEKKMNKNEITHFSLKFQSGLTQIIMMDKTV